MAIEIYVRDIATDEAIRWAQSKVPGLEVGDVVDDVHYLQASGDLVVVVTPRIEHGPFTSIYIAGDELGWESARDLAIKCASELRKTVRWCDDGGSRWNETEAGAVPTAVDWD